MDLAPVDGSVLPRTLLSPNDQVQRAGASPLVITRTSFAPAPLQPPVRRVECATRPHLHARSTRPIRSRRCRAYPSAVFPDVSRRFVAARAFNSTRKFATAQKSAACISALPPTRSVALTSAAQPHIVLQLQVYRCLYLLAF
jgi:hypothetical protein